MMESMQPLNASDQTLMQLIAAELGMRTMGQNYYRCNQECQIQVCKLHCFTWASSCRILQAV